MPEPLWTAEEIASATGGEVQGSFAVTGVSIDTRTLQPGDLFVALAGERDGHAFVTDALSRGAAGVLASQAVDAPTVRVADTLRALEQLGVAARDRAPDAKRCAVTGSVGKTSVTQAIAAALRLAGPSHNSVLSYNNHIGVPLTLARMPLVRPAPHKRHAAGADALHMHLRPMGNADAVGKIGDQGIQRVLRCLGFCPGDVVLGYVNGGDEHGWGLASGIVQGVVGHVPTDGRFLVLTENGMGLHARLSGQQDRVDEGEGVGGRATGQVALIAPRCPACSPVGIDDAEIGRGRDEHNGRCVIGNLAE